MKRLVIASTLDTGVPYQLVSMAAIIRDFDEPEYKSEGHRLLTDIADTLYNVGIGPDDMKEMYKVLYYQYGKEYWDKVLKDMSAIDSQLTSQAKEEELLADYNDRIGITASTAINANSDYLDVYQKGYDYLTNYAETHGVQYYEIAEDSYEYENGLIFIEYDDPEHEYEINHFCIDLNNPNEWLGVSASTKVTASAWVAPNGKKYGKQTRRFPGKYLFTRRELKSMVDEGVANELDVDINSLNYDIVGISWNDTNGYRSGILIKDRDSGELFVGNTADANVARLS